MDIFAKYITAKNIIFFIVAALIITFLVKIKDVAILFFASYVIACSLNPIVDKMVSKKLNRSLASCITLFGALGFISLFIIPIFVMGGHQIKSFLHMIPTHLGYVKAFIANIPFLQASSLHNINVSDVVSTTSGITSNVVSSSITFSKGIASAIIYFLAACIIIYYFMADKEIVKKAYLSFFPKNIKNRANEIIESISEKIGGYVIAQLVTILSVGIIVFIGLWILRVDYAGILALITAIFDLVPIVGPTVAFIIIMLVVYKLGLLKICLVIGVFIFAQWAENNLVRPYIFSKFLNIHPLVIYLFLFITAQYLGLVGVVFAPAIAATVCVLIEELYIKNINS